MFGDLFGGVFDPMSREQKLREADEIDQEYKRRLIQEDLERQAAALAAHSSARTGLSSSGEGLASGMLGGTSRSPYSTHAWIGTNDEFLYRLSGVIAEKDISYEEAIYILNNYEDLIKEAVENAMMKERENGS